MLKNRLAMCFIFICTVVVTARGHIDSTIKVRDSIVTCHGVFILDLTGRERGLGWLADNWTMSISGSDSRTSIVLPLSDIDFFASSVAKLQSGISFVYANSQVGQKIVFAQVTADNAFESAIDYDVDKTLLDIVRIDASAYLLICCESMASKRMLVDTMYVLAAPGGVDSIWIARSEILIDSVDLYGEQLVYHSEPIHGLTISPPLSEWMYEGIRGKTAFSFYTISQMSAINNSKVDVRSRDGDSLEFGSYNLQSIRSLVRATDSVSSVKVLIRGFCIVDRKTAIILGELYPVNGDLFGSRQQLLFIRQPGTLLSRKILPNIRIIGIHRELAQIYAALLSSANCE